MSGKRCVHCGEMNRSDAMHCARCGGYALVAGVSKVVRCASCGRVAPNPQAYCGGCGRDMYDPQRVPMLERRSSALSIFFAVLVLVFLVIPGCLAFLLYLVIL